MTGIQGVEKPSIADLAHHGVKGMKWGVRRDATSGIRPIAATLNNSRFGRMANNNAQRHMDKQNAKAARPKKLTREQVKAERDAFYQAKADRILKTAMNDHTSLIALRTQNDAVIVTGREFLQHMSSGGLMDIRATDVWATKASKNGPYVLNPDINRRFVRSDKNK